MRRAKDNSIEVQRVNPLTRTHVIDALIGEEEQTGKKKKERNKETGNGPQSIWLPPTTRIDHTVSPFFYFLHNACELFKIRFV